jgi:hypothetical protein
MLLDVNHALVQSRIRLAIAPDLRLIRQSGRDPVHHGDRMADPAPNEQRIPIAAPAQEVGIPGRFVFGVTAILVQHQMRNP